MKKKIEKRDGNNKSKTNPKENLSNKPQQATDAATKKSDSRKCWNCHALESEEVRLLKCGGCKKARYCDQACQEQDWDRHQEHCQHLQERKRNKK